MPSVCLYFQIHQPRRLKRFTVFDIDAAGAPAFARYEAEDENRRILARVVEKCYRPATRLLGDLVAAHAGRFRCAFSITGVTLDRLAIDHPDVLDAFRALAATGCVEFLNETYEHTLAFPHDPEEFRAQVRRHRERIRDAFGQEALTFRGTELIFSDALVQCVAELGYRVMLAEGAEPLLRGRSPNRVYGTAGDPRIRVLLRNYRLSDDIAFRFSDRGWTGFPLTAAKFAHWVHALAGTARVVNLFMDYETFGEHQWAGTGIFRFLEALPGEILGHPAFRFHTPAEAAEAHPVEDILDCPGIVTWADRERDLTAWQGNAMQQDALRALYRLSVPVQRRRDPDLLDAWRLLQTSDHFYYMCTKWSADGDVHRYFNPYASPYDAYVNFMNVLDDFTERVAAARPELEEPRC